MRIQDQRIFKCDAGHIHWPDWHLEEKRRARQTEEKQQYAQQQQQIQPKPDGDEGS
jgi:hypothetical protein